MAWARAYSGGFNNRAAIADQPRTNRGFHRHFLKIELIWVVRLWTLLFWFFFAIGYHYWTQCLGRPEYSTLCYMPCNIDFSTSNSRFFYNKCLSQSRTNRRSITMQGFTIADAEIHMPFHNSWTWICDRLPYIPVIFYLIHPYPNLSYLDLDLFEKDWLGIFKAWYPAIEDIATRPQIHSIGLG